MTAPTFRPGISEISAYKPGRSARDLGLTGPEYKLSANESALGPSPAAMRAVEEIAAKLHDYPDGGATKLRETVGAKFGIDPDCVVGGAGSDDILCLLMRCVAGPGDSIVQTKHGFSMYHIIARSCGATPVFAPETNLTTDVDAILGVVDDTTKAVFIANPNNPTGTYIYKEELQRLRAGLRDEILLVLDSAYAEFVEDPGYDDGMSLVTDAIATGADNIAVTRTFSKMYGLGGMRLGYGYAPPVIVGALNRIRGPFNVSAPAIAAGVAALNDTAFVEANLVHNRQHKPVLEQRMGGFGLEVVRGAGNFILARVPGASDEDRAQNANELVAFLEARGIFIRAMGGYFLPDYVRITVGSAEGLEALYVAMAEFPLFQDM